MKLLHVRVEGVGRFGTPSVLEGLGPGVNILSAANEAGKSTLFRAIRTCLFERYNTKKEEVERLATDGLSLPVSITLGFEHDGETYTISKSFLRSASSSLSRGGTLIARNREADETLWDILGIRPDTRLDPAAYGLLWVEQGQSFEAPKPSEGAASVLNSVIQQEVGTLVGGERARLLLKEAKETLGKLLNDNGKPKKGGPLAAAQDHFETAEQRRIEAERRLGELDGNLDRLAELRSSWERLGDKAETARMARELAEAQASLKESEDAVQSLQRFIAEEAQALSLREAQKGKLDQLLALASEIDEHRRRAAELASQIAGLDERIDAAAQAHEAAMSERNRLDAALAGLDTRDGVLQRAAAFQHNYLQRSGLMARFEVLSDLDRRLKASAAALEANGAGKQAVDMLETLEREAETIRIRNEAAAARLAIAVKPGVRVTINGELAAAQSARPVTEALAINVEDLAAITVTPAAASREAADGARAAIREKLKTLFAKHGVSDSDGLRRMREARLDLETAAMELRGERQALGIGDPGPASEIQRLDAMIRQIDAENLQRFAGLDSASLPSAGEAAAEREQMAQQRGGLRTARAHCDASLKRHNETLAGLEKSKGEWTGEKRVIESRLASSLSVVPDEARAQILSAAQRDYEDKAALHRGKAELLAAQRASVPLPEEIERRRLRADRLDKAVASRAAALDKLLLEIATLEGQVLQAGGDGLGEKAAELQAESAIARREVERQSERAAVLQLLRKVVEEAYDKRREELTAPLKRHLQPFLGDVFPRADIELGEGFAVAGLKRTGPASEHFDKLSRGTQEQIAVLVRLAMGAMIRDKGHDVPIILDDALVFSDDARIEQMFDAINRAGKNQQVIVLTCRARSFATLGGRELRIG